MRVKRVAQLHPSPFHRSRRPTPYATVQITDELSSSSSSRDAGRPGSEHSADRGRNRVSLGRSSR